MRIKNRAILILRRFTCAAWIVAVAFAAVTPTARAGVILTYLAPGVQSSSASNITVESFDGFAPGSYTGLVTAVGTFDFATIQPADV